MTQNKNTGTDKAHFLTPKQKKVLEWIEHFLARNHTLPSRREIAEGLGLSSPATVQQHIEALEKKGYLKRSDSREARTLQWTAESRKLFKVIRNQEVEQEERLQKEMRLEALQAKEALDAKESSEPSGHDMEIPWLGTIAAGYPIEVFPTDRTLSIPISYFLKSNSTKKPSSSEMNSVYALTVRGESMIDEGIFPDDVVILKKIQNAKSGDTIAALLNGEATLKTLIKTKSGFELHPANPKFPVIPIKNNDRFEVQGILVGLMRKY